MLECQDTGANPDHLASHIDTFPKCPPTQGVRPIDQECSAESFDDASLPMAWARLELWHPSTLKGVIGAFHQPHGICRCCADDMEGWSCIGLWAKITVVSSLRRTPHYDVLLGE